MTKSEYLALVSAVDATKPTTEDAAVVAAERHLEHLGLGPMERSLAQSIRYLYNRERCAFLNRVPVCHRPLVPREGMRGFYAALTKAWGNPNRGDHRWPCDVLEQVCESGPALPIHFDAACPPGLSYGIQ